MRNLIRAVSCALALFGVAHTLAAQALGPQRQFLAVEPYYEHTRLDVGSAASKEDLNAFGGRLWINLDPFHFILNSSIALYASHAPSQSGSGQSLTTMGAQYDQFFVRRPLGGLIDPFISLGGGAVRIRNERNTTFGATGRSEYYGSATGGGGLRVAIPNRLELRGDVRDLIIFGTPTGAGGTKRATNNLVLQAGVGLTF